VLCCAGSAPHFGWQKPPWVLLNNQQSAVQQDGARGMFSDLKILDCKQKPITGRLRPRAYLRLGLGSCA
jgi:hypothetical protein